MSYLPGIWASSRPSAKPLYLVQTRGSTQNTNDLARTWGFDSTTGFGTPVSGPANQTQGTMSSSRISVNVPNTAISFSGQFPTDNNQQTFNVYKTASGTVYGTRYSAPAGWVNRSSGTTTQTFGNYGIVWNYANNAFAVWNPSYATNNARVFRWDDTSGVGTQYANFSTVTISRTWLSQTWGAADDLFAFAGGNYGSSTPGTWASYYWNSSSGAGAAVAAPSPFSPNNVGRTANFRPPNPNGTRFIIVAFFVTGTGHRAAVYPYTDNGGFGTQFFIASHTDLRNTAWSKDGSLLATVGAFTFGNQTFAVTRFTSDAGTTSIPAFANREYTDTPGIPAFTPDNKAIAAGGNPSPFIRAWPWTNASGFGTRFAGPSSGFWASVGGQDNWTDFVTV